MECPSDDDQGNESKLLFVTGNKTTLENSNKYCLNDEELDEETIGDELDEEAPEFKLSGMTSDNKLKIRISGGKTSDKRPDGRTPGHKVRNKTPDDDIKQNEVHMPNDGITTNNGITSNNGFEPNDGIASTAGTVPDEGNHLKMVTEFETAGNRIKKEIQTNDVDEDIDSEIRNKYMSYINQANTGEEESEGVDDINEGTEGMEDVDEEAEGIEDADEGASNNYMLMLTKDNEYVPITNGRKENLNTIEKRPFKCDLCGKQFTEFCSLKRHNLVHTKEKPHVCSVCGRPFSRYESLTRHMMIHSGDKPHKCEVCGKRFTFPHILNRHLLIHTGDKPYECHICGKMFTLSYHVTRHLLTHTGEKPFSCEICGRQFSQRGDLSRHELLHSESNPNTCYICGRGFTKLKHLERHIEIHESQIASLTCEICGRKFEKTRSKKMHMKAHVRNAPEPGTVSDEVMQLYIRQKMLMEKKGKSGRKNKDLNSTESEDEVKNKFDESQKPGTVKNWQSTSIQSTNMFITKTKIDIEKTHEKGKLDVMSFKNENGRKYDKIYQEPKGITSQKSDKLIEKQSYETICQKVLLPDVAGNVKLNEKVSKKSSLVVGSMEFNEKVRQTITPDAAGNVKFHGKVRQLAVPDVADKVNCCNICGIYFLNVDQFKEHMATIHEDEILMEEGEEFEAVEVAQKSEKEINNSVDMSKRDSNVDSNFKYVL